MPHMLSTNNQQWLASVRAGLSDVAQSVFEKTYLTAFDGSNKNNLHEMPVERISHGAQHVSRVMALIPIRLIFCVNAIILKH